MNIAKYAYGERIRRSILQHAKEKIEKAREKSRQKLSLTVKPEFELYEASMLLEAIEAYNLLPMPPEEPEQKEATTHITIRRIWG